MKKQLLRFVSGFIPALALFSQVNAQVAKASFEFNLKEAISTEALSYAAINGETNTANVNTRALKDFTKSFKDAENVSWSAMKDGFLASFKENGVETKAYYDQKGRWTATIRTYKEDKLPKDVRKQVKSTYYDYIINQISEVTVGQITAYLVRIEDEETFKTIRVIDGEMDVYEDHKKAH